MSVLANEFQRVILDKKAASVEQWLHQGSSGLPTSPAEVGRGRQRFQRLPHGRIVIRFPAHPRARWEVRFPAVLSRCPDVDTRLSFPCLP
ncbi:hypothetical protein MRX96_026349 [Rhipicephalus microplus]